MREIKTIGPEEMQAQREYMRLVREIPERPQSYHIVSMGCQMNARDSETIAGMLEEMGMRREDVRERADLILYNTCCVRENAENKALGNVIWLKELKKEKPELMICVGGCMTQEHGMAAEMKRKYPFIDLIYGTHNLYRLPEYVYDYLTTRTPVVAVVETDGEVVEGMPERRERVFSSFVNIMYGCNNFCSYCIVPYVRGRERSREPEAIIREVEGLLERGAQEITLLGQNVNSYRGGGAEFANLLRRLDALGVPRIRFMTSHPKDLSDELIDAYGTLEHLMPALHLPVQAGNNEILHQMNRRYTREHYLELVEKLRRARPDIGLTSDIIVGFPGETQAQFEDTMLLVRQVRFDAAYTFIYSPRRGTRAAEMPDPVTAEEKSIRIQKLIELQQAISAETLQAQVGRRETLLVEGVSTRNAQTVGGRTPRGHMVNFEGGSELTGKFVEVEITSAGRNTLRGKMI